MEEETLVKNSSACKDYLIEAMKYHLLPAEQRSMMKTIRTRVRTPISYPKVCKDSLDFGHFYFVLFLFLLLLDIFIDVSCKEQEVIGSRGGNMIDT